MNKIASFGLGALAMLGVGAGAVAIVNTAPATKNKLNVSFGDKVLIGTEPKDEVVTQDPAKTDVVAVSYVFGGQTTTVLQEKVVLQGDLILAYLNEQAMIENPMSFLGWTKTQGGTDIVYKVEEDTTLYPVLLEFQDAMISATIFDGHDVVTPDEFSMALPFHLDLEWSKNVTNDLGQVLTLKALGLVDSENIDGGYVFEFNAEKQYVMKYYVEELDREVLATEFDEIYAEFLFGDNAALKDEKVFVLNSLSHSTALTETLLTAYLHTQLENYFSTYEVNGISYRCCGFAASADSTEIVLCRNMIAETPYYVVYRNVSDETDTTLYSYQDLLDLKNQ